MSSLLAKAGEAIRNSPLMARKGASDYALAQDDDHDPFTSGVTFYCEHVGSADLPPEAGRGDKNNDAVVESIYSKARSPLRKFTVLVKDKSIRLKDINSGQVLDEVPIHLISYCGSHIRLDRAFCLVYRHSGANRMRVELFQAADKAKAQAMVKTVSKAFNIAYGSWQAKAKEKQRTSLAANKDSPRAQRRNQEAAQTQRGNPVAQQNAQNTAKGKVEEVTEQMGAVTVTLPKCTQNDDIEDEFTALAASRSQPDLLANDIGADPNQFSWSETKAHADPGSTPNLLDL